MKTVLSKENVNTLLLAIMLVGLGLAIYSTYQYLDYRNQIADIDEQRDAIRKEAEIIASGQTVGSATPLAGRDIVLRRERNDLVNDQNAAMRRAGVGLAVIAIGWLAFDFVRSWRRKRAQPVNSS